MRLKENTYSKILLLFFLISVVYIAGFVLFTEFRKLIFITPDDASYYLKIAENFPVGKGFTFDGINPTNGFQPLWQYLLITLTYLNLRPELMLRVIFLLQIILLTISAMILYKVQRKFFSKEILLPGGIIFITFVFLKAVNGMETALLIFFISLLYNYSVKNDLLNSQNNRKDLFAGMLLGLVILARLDTVFLAASIGFFSIAGILINSLNRTQQLKKLLYISLGTILVVSPYMIYNLITFGNIIPISGYLKSGFPIVTFSDKFSFMMGYREMFFAFFAIIYFVWFCISYPKPVIRSSSIRSFCIYMGIFSLFTAMYFLYTVLFMNWVIFSWYFIYYALFASLISALPFKYMLSSKIKFRRMIYIGATAFLLFYGVFKTYQLYEGRYAVSGNNWNIESYNAALWAKENTAPEEIFSMKDAGHFSYFSGRRVINLDGLVNNFEYQEILKNKNLNEYLKKHNVRFYVTHAIWDRDDITDGKYDTLMIKIPSHKYSLESDPLLLKKENELYRSAPYYDGEYRAAFIIWNLSY
ncbi:MAG: hypothetical protein SGI89_11750 [bacterium]|nr:hypothetical protein [bacterium]